MAAKKQTQQLARQLYKLSFENGQITAERVAGVLAYVEKIQPPQIVAVLKAYQRLVTAELARGQAVVEHAGAVSPAALQAIAAALSKKYGRPVASTAKANPSLLAGLRIRVGDDVYENSVAGQLGALSAAV
jgi:F-type H+-transporting ATPase subunit delta